MAIFFDLNKAVRLGEKIISGAVTWWSVFYLSFSSEIQANLQLMCVLAGHKTEYGSPARSISIVQSWPDASLLNLLRTTSKISGRPSLFCHFPSLFPLWNLFLGVTWPVASRSIECLKPEADLARELSVELLCTLVCLSVKTVECCLSGFPKDISFLR